MDKKILALLAIFIVAVSLATVYAGEELVSHDFGKFKMDIPQAKEAVAETHGGSGNQTIYSVPNPDLTEFAHVEYWDTSNTNGSKNTTDVVLNKIKVNYTMKNEGDTSCWVSKDSREEVYLISSDDDTRAVIIVGSDTRLPQAAKSVEFK